jgi:hypothetical protein
VKFGLDVYCSYQSLLQGVNRGGVGVSDRSRSPPPEQHCSVPSANVTRNGRRSPGCGVLPRTTRRSLVSSARGPDIPGVPVPAVSALGRGQHPAWSALHTVDMDDVPLLRGLWGDRGGAGCRDPPASPRRPSSTCCAPGSHHLWISVDEPAVPPPPWLRAAGQAITTPDQGSDTLSTTAVLCCIARPTGGRACILTPLDTKEGASHGRERPDDRHPPCPAGGGV